MSANSGVIFVGDWGDKRRRREDRGAEGVEGVGCGELKKASFGAFLVLFFQLNCMKTG